MKRGRQRKAAVHHFTFAGYGLDRPPQPLEFPRCKCGHLKPAHHRGHGECLNCYAEHTKQLRAYLRAIRLRRTPTQPVNKHCPFYREEQTP